jgi:hypothetical protein
MGMRTPAASNANFWHNNDLFLPWHQQYLMDFETELQKVDSEVAFRTGTGPNGSRRARDSSATTSWG